MTEGQPGGRSKWKRDFEGPEDRRLRRRYRVLGEGRAHIKALRLGQS
jgi:hypothetical protein